MKLQVIIEPPNGGARSHKRRLQDDRVRRRFVEIAPATVTLDDLCASICQRYKKLYTGTPDLIIYKLQDFEGNDLDLSYKVGDVFVDKDISSEGSTVRVFQVLREREASLPPESALRPRKRHRISSPQLDSVAEGPTRNRGSHLPPTKRIRRTSAMSLQEIIEDSSEETEFRKADVSSSEDDPVASRKRKNKFSTKLPKDDGDKTGEECKDDRILEKKPNTNPTLSRRSPLLGGVDSSFPSASGYYGDGGGVDDDDDDDEDEDEEEEDDDDDDDDHDDEEEEEEKKKKKVVVEKEKEGRASDQIRYRDEIQVPSTEPEVLTTGGPSQDSISDSTPPIPIKRRNKEAAALVSHPASNRLISEELSSPPAPRRIIDSVQIIRPAKITYQSNNRTPVSKRLRSNGSSTEKLEGNAATYRGTTTDSFDFIPSEDESSKSPEPETISKTGIKPTARKSMQAQLGSNFSSRPNNTSFIFKPPAHKSTFYENTLRVEFIEEELAQSQNTNKGKGHNDHQLETENSGEKGGEISAVTKSSSKKAKSKRIDQRGKSKGDTSPTVANSRSKETSTPTKAIPITQRKVHDKEEDDLPLPENDLDVKTHSDDSSEPIGTSGRRRVSKGATTRVPKSAKQGKQAKDSSVKPSPTLNGKSSQRRKSVTFAAEPQVKEPTQVPEKPAPTRKSTITILPPLVPPGFEGSSTGRFEGRGHRRRRPPGPVNATPEPKLPPVVASASQISARPSRADNLTTPIPAAAPAPVQAQLPVPTPVPTSNQVHSKVVDISSDGNLESNESDDEREKTNKNTSKSDSIDEKISSKKIDSNDEDDDDSSDGSSKASSSDDVLSSDDEGESVSHSSKKTPQLEELQSFTDRSQPILQDTEMEDVGADVEDNIDMDLDTQDIVEVESPLFARRSGAFGTLKTSTQEISMPARAVEDQKADGSSDDGGTSNSIRSTPPQDRGRAKARDDSLVLSDDASSLPEPKRSKEATDDQEVEQESDSSEETESASDEAEKDAEKDDLSSQSGSTTASSSELESDEEEDGVSRNQNLRSASPKVVATKRRQTARSSATKSASPEKELVISNQATTALQASKKRDSHKGAHQPSPDGTVESLNQVGKHNRVANHQHAHPSPPASGTEGAISHVNGVEAAAATALFNMKSIDKRDRHSSPAKGNRSEPPLRSHGTPKKEVLRVSASQTGAVRSRSNTPNNNLHPPNSRGQIRKLSPAKIVELAASGAPSSSQTKLPSSQHGQWLGLSQLMQQNVPETRERTAKGSADWKSSQSQPKTPLPRVPQSDSGSESDSESESGSGSGSQSGSDGDDDNSSDGGGASRSIIPPEQMAGHNTPDSSRQNKGIKSLLNFRNIFRSSQT